MTVIFQWSKPRRTFLRSPRQLLTSLQIHGGEDDTGPVDSDNSLTSDPPRRSRPLYAIEGPLSAILHEGYIATNRAISHGISGFV